MIHSGMNLWEISKGIVTIAEVEFRKHGLEMLLHINFCLSFSLIEARYSLCIWFADSGDFGIGYWEYSNMGLFTVELREGAWYMWALFKYSKTEWGSAHTIEYLWKRFLLHASISQF